MIPVLFHIGPLSVYSYGMMMALGFLAADYVITLECRRRGIVTEYASSIVVWAAILGISCARVLDLFGTAACSVEFSALIWCRATTRSAF